MGSRRNTVAYWRARAEVLEQLLVDVHHAEFHADEPFDPSRVARQVKHHDMSTADGHAWCVTCRFNGPDYTFSMLRWNWHSGKVEE